MDGPNDSIGLATAAASEGGEPIAGPFGFLPGRSLMMMGLLLYGLRGAAKAFVGIVLLPSQLDRGSKHMQGAVLQRLGSSADRVFIRVDDSIKLSGLIINKNPTKKPEDVKWIVYLNANGVAWEHIALELDGYAAEVKCNILVVNYRGVGESSGSATSAAGLIQDACASVDYLVTLRGAQLKNIMLQGHSMGGAVAIECAAKYQNQIGAVLVDRSFVDLPSLVRTKIVGPLGAFAGFAVALIAFCSVSVVVYLGFGYPLSMPPPPVSVLIFYFSSRVLQPMLDYVWGPPVPRHGHFGVSVQASIKLVVSWFAETKAKRFWFCCLAALQPCMLDLTLKSIFKLVSLSGLFEYFVLSASLGIALGYTQRIDFVVERLIMATGWDLNVSKSWEQLRIPKGVIYHKYDEMIPLEVSLARLTSPDDEFVLPIEIRMPPSNHMVFIMTLPRHAQFVKMFCDHWKSISS